MRRFKRYKPIKTHEPQPPRYRANRDATELAPGIYFKDGQVDVYTEELLEHFGWPDTEENRDTVTQVAHQVMGQFFKIPEEARHVTHGHECPIHHTITLHEGLGCGLPRVSTAACGVCLS